MFNYYTFIKRDLNRLNIKKLNFIFSLQYFNIKRTIKMLILSVKHKKGKNKFVKLF